MRHIAISRSIRALNILKDIVTDLHILERSLIFPEHQGPALDIDQHLLPHVEPHGFCLLSALPKSDDEFPSKHCKAFDNERKAHSKESSQIISVMGTSP